MIHFGLTWYGAVWFDVVWFGMVRLSCGVVQFDLVRLVPYVMMYMAWQSISWYGRGYNSLAWYETHMVWYGLTWYGMAEGSKLTPGLWDKTVIGGKIIHAPHVTLY